MGEAPTKTVLCSRWLTQRGCSLNTLGMHEENLAILKALVPVAWADGKFADEEKETLEGLLMAFDATASEAQELREWAKTPRTIEDIPLTDLSFDDRRVVLQHAVFLSHADGDYSEPEKKLIAEMIKKLRIEDQEASSLIEVATARAKKYLNLI